MNDKAITNLVAKRTHMLRHFVEKSTNGELFISEPDICIRPLDETATLTSVAVAFHLWTKENSNSFATLYYGNVNYEKDYSIPLLEKEDVFLSDVIEQLRRRQVNFAKNKIFPKTVEMLEKVIDEIQNYLFPKPERQHSKSERYPVKPLKREEENEKER